MFRHGGLLADGPVRQWTYHDTTSTARVTYPQPAGQTGRQVGYEYDSLGRLPGVTAGGAAFANQFTYTHGALLAAGW